MSKMKLCGRYWTVAATALSTLGILALAQDRSPTCDADLELVSVAVVGSNEVRPGDKPWVNVVIKNNRNSSSASMVKLKLRSTKYSVDLAWGEYDIGVLEVNQDVSFISDFQIPPYLRADTYDIVATCGFGANEAPGSKKNNEKTTQIVISDNPGAASGTAGVNSDLILNSISAPSSAATGTYANVTIKIKNQQNSACMSTTQVFLNNTVSPYATNYWYAFSVSALANGAVYTNTSTKLVPSLPNTRHCIMVVCGAGNSGCEQTSPDKRLNNTNNCSASPIDITY